MGYETVFGGTNIYPADVTYLALALTADVDLDWPMESAAPPYPLARIIDVIANGPHIIRLPKANEGSVGAIVLFNLLTASSSQCFVVDYDGVAVATLGVGKQWEIYLTDNDDPAGAWSTFQLGASTATVQPSALAGFGLTVTGSTLSQSVPVTTFTATPRTALPSDRASALVWTGPGSGTLNLPGVSAVGNNFFLSARNAGGGMLNLDPLGTEVIDGGATVALSPGEGVVLVTDGLVWYTLGRGQAAIFAFDYTAINVAGAHPPDPAGTYTLTGSELNRIAYKFFGALTTNIVVIVPSTFQQYWVDNATTGAFTLSLNTSTGVAVSVPQGARAIYYCDGTNVVNASTGGIALPISASQGGTGQSAYAVGDLLVASSPSTLAKLTAVPVGNALISGGAGAIPLWGKIDLATMVTGTLPAANGGGGGLIAGSVIFAGPGGALAQDNTNFNWNDATNVLGVAGSIILNGAPVLTSASSGAFLSSAQNVMVNDAGGQPRFYFSSGGPTYHVSPTGHNFRINGAGGPDPVTIDTSGNLAVTGAATINGNVASGGFSTGGTVTAAGLYADPSYGMFMQSGSPILNFDANDYMHYNRAANTLTVFIGGVQSLNVTSSSVQVGGGGTAVLYMGNGNSYLASDATSATWLWEPNCYMQFNKGTDVLSFVINSGIYMDIRPGLVTANSALTVAGAATFNGGSVYCQSAGGNPRSALYSDAGTGYLALFNGDAGRQGYIGAGVAAGAMIYANDRGGGHSFSGGDLVCANNVAAFSDAKLKTNLRVIPNALDGVCSLTGYTYERTDQVDGRRHTGLIAQDVQKVLPEAVGESDGTLTLSYGNMVGLLVEAIKELRAEVADLRSRIP